MTTVDAARLRSFTASAFERVGVPADEAALAADVLVTADLRAVESHGIARLHHYLDRIRSGIIPASVRLDVEREAPTTVALDAHHSLGMPAACRAMELC